MTRKCSNCGNAGHNSRTCNNININISNNNDNNDHDQRTSSNCGLATKLFRYPSYSSQNCSFACFDDENFDIEPANKKGVPWSEEEHRTFLVGLETLGRGDWRGISRLFVTTRTPTQIASHAQKYFIRHDINNNHNNNKRRRSLFDMVCKVEPKALCGKKPKPKSSSIIIDFSYSSYLSTTQHPNSTSQYSITTSIFNNNNKNNNNNNNNNFVQRPSPDLELTLGGTIYVS